MTFIVVIDNYFSKDTGKIFGRENTLTEARKIAYKTVKAEHKTVTIFDDSLVPPFVFSPTGQKLKSTLGEEIAEVNMHNAGAFAGKVFYYPDYHSEYYKKRNAKFHKYFLNRDGSLGQGTW